MVFLMLQMCLAKILRQLPFLEVGRGGVPLPSRAFEPPTSWSRPLVISIVPFARRPNHTRPPARKIYPHKEDFNLYRISSIAPTHIFSHVSTAPDNAHMDSSDRGNDLRTYISTQFVNLTEIPTVSSEYDETTNARYRAHED